MSLAVLSTAAVRRTPLPSGLKLMSLILAEGECTFTYSLERWSTMLNCGRGEGERMGEGGGARRSLDRIDSINNKKNNTELLFFKNAVGIREMM